MLFINLFLTPMIGLYLKFCTIDIFPTVLSSMGFSIAGNRLGLGTDLFSATETLSEEMGIEELNNEFSKYSEYYIDNFS